MTVQTQPSLSILGGSCLDDGLNGCEQVGGSVHRLDQCVLQSGLCDGSHFSAVVDDLCQIYFCLKGCSILKLHSLRVLYRDFNIV